MAERGPNHEIDATVSLNEQGVETRVSASAGLIREGSIFAERYRIETLLGKGGMGNVYRAYDALLDEMIALKTLELGHSDRASALDRFQREIRLSRKITHPNVVRTHDLGVHDGVFFFTMELVKGRTLQDLLKERARISPKEAAELGVQICEGLWAAHQTGVVHRDLKPANVLLEDTGRVVVTDFGIARSTFDQGEKTVGVVGTPLYMSPEQVAGTGVDPRSDIYSFGLLLFEMLTGRMAFDAPDVLVAAVARLNNPAPDPRTLLSLPDWLAELVLCCLAKEPSQRPPDAKAVAEALRAWVKHGATAELAGSGASISRDQTMISQTQSTGEGKALVAAVAVAIPGQNPAGSSSASGQIREGGSSRQNSISGVSSTPVSNSADFAVAVPQSGRALAVLPMRYLGPPDNAYLGEALTDELIDILSRTRGLRVLSSSATKPYEKEREPKKVGSELNVDAIVDATIQATGRDIRVSARLIEVATGTQLWSDKFEAPLADVFELQERMTKRIAEALRLGLGTVVHRGGIAADAVELYLHGRRKVAANNVVGEGAALDLLNRCLALAPNFLPAIATHALASMRAWSTPRDGNDATNWQENARISVERAMAVASELPESHLAYALYSLNRGKLKDAAQALVHALEIAPTFAEAHQVLGQLQCEAGRASEGVKRLELALYLNPTMSLCRIDLARVAALRGDMATYDKHVAYFDENRIAGGIAFLRMRVGAWVKDKSRIEEAKLELLEQESVAARFGVLMARAYLGEIDALEVVNVFDDALAMGNSPRMRSLILQFATELAGAVGQQALCMKYFQAAVDEALVDYEWAIRCPVIECIRSLPEFAAAKKQLRARVEAIWSL